MIEFSRNRWSNIGGESKSRCTNIRTGQPDGGRSGLTHLDVAAIMVYLRELQRANGIR